MRLSILYLFVRNVSLYIKLRDTQETKNHSAKKLIRSMDKSDEAREKAKSMDDLDKAKDRLEAASQSYRDVTAPRPMKLLLRSLIMCLRLIINHLRDHENKRHKSK